jgi:GAF domain-containing protein
MPQQALLTTTLVELADTLVEDFDVVDLLTLLVDRCVAILDIAAAGLMLVAPEGDLRLAASSSEAMRVVELFELQSEEGPCLDCHRIGEPVLNEDLAAVNGRWPTFAPVAYEAGFRAVHAIPMRLRRRIIGALNLFDTETRPLSAADARAGQALADMATIAILQHRAALEAQTITEQLNSALTSRVLIEQAKGMLAERANIEIPEAFETLRSHARVNNLRLADVAQDLLDGTLPTARLIPPQPADGSRR